MEMMARIGAATEVVCYRGMGCTCHLRHRLWLYGIKGSDNIFDEFKSRYGRFIGGVWYPAPGSER